MLPPPRALTVSQGRYNAQRGPHSGSHVPHCCPHARWPVGTRQAHKAGMPLCDLVEPGPIPCGASAAITRNARVHQCRIVHTQCFIAQAHRVRHAGPKILHQNSTCLHHAAYGGLPIRMAKVKRKTQLASVGAEVVGTLVGSKGAPCTRHVATIGRLYFYNCCA